jgi:hypothetical protein
MKKSKKPLPPERRIMADEDAFRLYVRQLCLASTQKAVAQKLGLDPGRLSRIVNGYDPIGEELADRFGFILKKTKTFIPKES